MAASVAPKRPVSTTTVKRPSRWPLRSPSVLGELHDDIRGADLLHLLPAGGARNALDCALWDLRAKQKAVPAWQAPAWRRCTRSRPPFTIGLGDEATTRRKLREARGYGLLKLKLDAIAISRSSTGHARNTRTHGWSSTRTRPGHATCSNALLPDLARSGVELVEQPLTAGEDAQLDGLVSPIPLAADESCTDRASLDRLAGRYQYINIKLDKCGGLTEALAMRAPAAERGLA